MNGIVHGREGAKRVAITNGGTIPDRGLYGVFLIGAENYRSQRAVEKIGAIPAGTRIDSRGQERLAFQITAPLFEKTLKLKT